MRAERSLLLSELIESRLTGLPAVLLRQSRRRDRLERCRQERRRSISTPPHERFQRLVTRLLRSLHHQIAREVTLRVPVLHHRGGERSLNGSGRISILPKRRFGFRNRGETRRDRASDGGGEGVFCVGSEREGAEDRLFASVEVGVAGVVVALRVRRLTFGGRWSR